MCKRLLRQIVCLHSQSPPQKLCVDDESLDSLVFVRTDDAIAEGASQPRWGDIYLSYISEILFFLNVSQNKGCENIISIVWNTDRRAQLDEYLSIPVLIFRGFIFLYILWVFLDCLFSLLNFILESISIPHSMGQKKTVK